MPKYQNLSDNELITFLREGDAAAYTEIYDRYFQLMFVFAYKKLRDEELAKDFTQELFVRLWERRSEVNITGKFSVYFYSSMRYKLLDHFAHLNVRNKYVEFLSDFIMHSKSEDADYRIRERQLSDYIERQIAALPPKMRRIFEMSRKEYLSHKEIADRLETSENNVSTQIMNSLRILKGKLKIIFLIPF